MKSKPLLALVLVMFHALSLQSQQVEHVVDEAMNLVKLRAMFTFIQCYIDSYGAAPKSIDELSKSIKNPSEREVFYLASFYQNPEIGGFHKWVIPSEGSKNILLVSTPFKINSSKYLYVLNRDGSALRMLMDD